MKKILYNQNVVITNVYTVVKAKLTDKEEGHLLDGGSFRLTFFRRTRRPGAKIMFFRRARSR